MNEERASDSKLVYHPPVLEVYGTMAELTAAGGPAPGADGPGPVYGVGLS